MATYYVDATGGNDAWPGTEAQPWQTIGKVNGEVFVAGDYVLFKRGETWTGTVLLVTWSGAAGNPITFGAYGTGAKPIIDGNDAVNCVIVNTQSYLNFENIDASQGLDFGFSFVTCHHIRLVDCSAHDCGNDQVIFITGCHDCVVLRGEFYAGYQRIVGTVPSGIEIADGGHDITLAWVACYGNVVGMGIAIHSHVATGMPYNIHVYNSHCYSNANHGIQIIKQ